jgi:hypothetical protein
MNLDIVAVLLVPSLTKPLERATVRQKSCLFTLKSAWQTVLIVRMEKVVKSADMDINTIQPRKNVNVEMDSISIPQVTLVNVISICLL